MTLRDQQSGLILLVEDNRQMAEMMGNFLEQRGYSLDYAADGSMGFKLAVANHYDVIVLDVRSPGMDGLEVCRKLRRGVAKIHCVLMLAEADTLEDKLAGLDAGADDYMVKPFDIRELDARLYALIRRRRRQVSGQEITVGSMTLDPQTLQVTREGKYLAVPRMDMKLLAILMRESPRLVSRQDIEREVWGDKLPDSDTLRSRIYNLRRIIDRPFENPLLHTMQSAGYRIADLSESPVAHATLSTRNGISRSRFLRNRTDNDKHVLHVGRDWSEEPSQSTAKSAKS